MAMITQSQPLSHRYGGGLKGTRTLSHKPLSRCAIHLCGATGSGKTHFCESHPGAYILNFDSKDTSNTKQDPERRAMKWPNDFDADGNPVDVDSKDRIRGLEPYNEQLEILYTLAANNEPRPETIIIDSVRGYTDLLLDWIPRHAAKLGLSSSDGIKWNDLHGKKSWGFLYDTIASTVSNLVRHGYGVWVISHVIDVTILSGDEAGQTIYDLAMPASLRKRMEGTFDLVGVVMEGKLERKVPSIHNGRQIMKTERYDGRILKFKDAKLDGVLRRSKPLPDTIELPEVDAYSYLEKLYNETAKGDSSPVTTPDKDTK